MDRTSSAIQLDFLPIDEFSLHLKVPGYEVRLVPLPLLEDVLSRQHNLSVDVLDQNLPFVGVGEADRLAARMAVVDLVRRSAVVQNTGCPSAGPVRRGRFLLGVQNEIDYFGPCAAYRHHRGGR